MKYVLTGNGMQMADRYTSEVFGLPSLVLMERAALKVADTVKSLSTFPKSVLVVCGSGNNGGDGFAVARLLKPYIAVTEVFFAGDHAHMSEQCALQESLFLKMGGKIVSSPTWDGYDVIVDALFGIGLTRAIHSPYSELIEKINNSRAAVIAVDIPSGIHPDTGAVMGAAVHADITVCFQYYQFGHVLYPGREYCGDLKLVDVGIVSGTADANAFILEKEDIPSLLPKRSRRSHKGDYGNAWINAGRKNMSGCACLAMEAAYRMGCGLVTGISAEENRTILQSSIPEALFIPDEVFLSALAEKSLSMKASAYAVGPGIGTDAFGKCLLDAALSLSEGPLIIDADALTLLSMDPHAMQKTCQRSLNHRATILTPHPGEMARLIHGSVREVLLDPVSVAMSYAKRSGCIVVLKDAATIVTDGVRIYLNTSGCDGMAVGGSGDVLTGIITGLCAQGMDPFLGAILGVCLHGLAGEEAQKQLGSRSMLASDIIRYIPKVLSGGEGTILDE